VCRGLSPDFSGENHFLLRYQHGRRIRSGSDGYETEEGVENQALSLARPANAKQLQKELEYIDHVMALGDQVRELQRRPNS